VTYVNRCQHCHRLPANSLRITAIFVYVNHQLDNTRAQDLVVPAPVPVPAFFGTLASTLGLRRQFRFVSLSLHLRKTSKCKEKLKLFYAKFLLNFPHSFINCICIKFVWKLILTAKMTLNTKSVVKRLEILKLSDSDNIVQYIVHSILNFLNFFLSHFLKDSL